MAENWFGGSGGGSGGGGSGGGSGGGNWFGSGGGGGGGARPGGRRGGPGGGGGWGFLPDPVEHLFTDVKDLFRGIPQGIALTGSALGHDIYHDLFRGVPLIGPKKRESSAVYSQLVKPTANIYRYQYGPLFSGNLGEFAHRLGEHPLGPILDVATVATLGSGAGVRLGATAGKLGSTGRLARYAENVRAPRMIEVRPGEGITPKQIEVRKAMTPYGRALNQLADVIGTRYQRAPIVGNIRREAGFMGRKLHAQRSRNIAVIRPFESTVKGLNDNERFAFHLAFEGRDPVATFNNALGLYKQTPSRQLRRYMERLAGKKWAAILKDPDAAIADSPITRLVKQPSEALVVSVRAGKTIDEMGGAALTEAGILTPEIREARKWLAQRMESGARFRSETDLNALRAQVEAGHTQVGERIAELERQGAKVARTQPKRSDLEKLGRKAARASDIRFRERPRAEKAERVRGLLDRQLNILATLQRRHAAGEVGSGRLHRAQERASRLQSSWEDLATSLIRYKQAEREGLETVEAQATTEAARREALAAQEKVADELSDAIGRYEEMLQKLEGSRQALEEAGPGFYGGVQMRELRARREAELAGRREGPVAPEFGMPARFPHEAVAERENILTALESRAPTRQPGLPGSSKKNRGVRLLTARLITDPLALSRDYLRTMGYQSVLDYWDYLKDYAKPLDPAKGGSPDDGFVYFRTGDAPIPREAREATPLMRDKFVSDLERGERTMTEKQIENLSKDIVWEKGDVGTAGFREGMTVEDMTAAGIQQIPEHYAKSFLRENKGRNEVLRKFFDRPLDVWRAVVLTYRPAWLVNNIVGQHLLYAINYFGPAGATAYLRALQLEKGDQPIRLLKRWTMAHKPRSKWGRILDEHLPGFRASGFFQSQEFGGPGLYVGEGRVGRHAERTMEKGKAHPARIAYKSVGVAGQAVRSFGDAMTWMNVHVADDMTRMGAFIREAERSRVIKNIRKQAKEFEGVNLKLDEAVARAAKTSPEALERVMDEVNRSLGNFAALGPIERNYIRRIVPFYSWFKTITAVAGRLAVDHPGRLAVLALMGRLAKENGIGLPAGPMPSYLQGAVPLGPAEGGEQTVLSTMAANPFETPIQLAEALGSAVPYLRYDPETGEPDPRSRGTGSIFGMLNPLVGAVAAAQGTDIFYGGPYRGPGAGRGWAAQFGGYFGGLPQFRLAEQLGYYGDYKSKLYDPEYRVAGIRQPVWTYLGLPVRRVKLREAESRARAGQ